MKKVASTFYLIISILALINFAWCVRDEYSSLVFFWEDIFGRDDVGFFIVGSGLIGFIYIIYYIVRKFKKGNQVEEEIISTTENSLGSNESNHDLKLVFSKFAAAFKSILISIILIISLSLIVVLDKGEHMGLYKLSAVVGLILLFVNINAIYTLYINSKRASE